jgi:hypothetical protein
MSEVGNLETLRGHFVSVRRQEVWRRLALKVGRDFRTENYT